MTSAFRWYELMAIDVERAAAFYGAVFGWRVVASDFGYPRFCCGDDAVAGLRTLPPPARAAGAPPHWLGHVAAIDVEDAAERAVALGSAPLGPVQVMPGGGDLARLKDPQGAVVGVSSTPMAAGAGVASPVLNTTSVVEATTFYERWAGWTPEAEFDLGPPWGRYQRLQAEGRPVAGVMGTARLPGVHPHWVYYFAVRDADDACETVRREGGQVIRAPAAGPEGDVLAYCEDNEGAAFGVMVPTAR